MSLVVFTVKAGQAYPTRFYQSIDYLKNESVSRSVTIVKFKLAFLQT